MCIRDRPGDGAGGGQRRGGGGRILRPPVRDGAAGGEHDPAQNRDVRIDDGPNGMFFIFQNMCDITAQISSLFVTEMCIRDRYQPALT